MFDLRICVNKFRQIRTYYADLPGNPPGVGANIQLRYSPAVTYNPLINYNPTTAGSELHWIGRVMSNHNFKTNQHGDTEDVIDVASGQPNPFYDLNPSVTFTDEDDFADGPARPDLQNDHYWSAELYLVEKTPGKQEVTIYNGISWGWRNTVTPPPPVSLPPCVGGSGGGGCLTTVSTNRNLLFFNSGNAAQFRKPVDEPTTALGLLALGAWGAVQGLKIRKSKQQ